MPLSVAIIGASSDRDKYGNKAVRAYVASGHTVYPISLKEKEIEGLRAYASIADVPGHIERVTMYVPPEIGIRLLEAIAEKGPEELFLNPGSESTELVSRAKELGLDPIVGCAIMDIGHSPSQY